MADREARPWSFVLCCLLAAACTASEKPTTTDFNFDGTCVNCHAGLSAAHVHANFKLKCVDCHGGNDQADVPATAALDPKVFRDPARLAVSHVKPKTASLARFFFANGIDDNGDGRVDEPPLLSADGKHLDDPGEVFEPQLHGEGPGEFIDTELQRDLNYTRFLNPGDLRVATATCGGRSGAGSGTGCHQETVDIVRRSIMVNQAAVINGAYYGNESWRQEFIDARANPAEPRAGAFAYSLDYDGVDQCITTVAGAPHFDSACLEARATSQDPAVAAGAPGNANLPAFEMAQGTIKPASQSSPGVGATQNGAGFTRYPWGGQADDPAAERAQLAPVPNGSIAGLPDPVDLILRTFRAYYPLNYPGSTNNFNFTFGTSILPEIARFKTVDPFGRGHSSGCSACHAPYSYDGARQPTQVLQDDGTTVAVVDPTTKHREFAAATQDRGTINGADHLIGRTVAAKEREDAGRDQQKTYSMAHSMTTKIDTDACGLCHGFVTRINNAYQGFAEEEQRDQLARKKEIDFTTPIGTKVRILDSWVREDEAITGGSVVVVPEGAGIVELAKKRDADLAKDGFVAGNGGCAQATFTEDCNNNGELDHNLVLTQVDETGKTIKTVTIDEDLNHNGSLDLIDRLPRERSVDGRQMRYVYGGRNGSTRQMDVHFERGMHCIDCHFLQDVHGDGHVYSTNWDAIEIECEDCHGGKARSNLKTSGPNGGNALTTAHDDNGVPYFEDKGGAIIQRSRVTPGVFWKVPQTIDDTSQLATEAHSKHAADPKEGSTFAGAQGSSALVQGKLECATCHSSWVHNCMGCHVDLNVGDPQRKTIDAAGNITATPGENEVWLSNANNPGHINFQLLGMLRAPFVLGVASKPEGGRLATFRSSMQAHVTATDATGDTIIDNATFTTFQALDANSGRMNVATSGVAMNQTMPHTVRPKEARGCEMCHTLVDSQGRARNEHILAETYGIGAGAIPFLGDWAMAVGAGGLELFDYKQERELGNNLIVGASTRFPGMVVNPSDKVAAKVEPLFDGSKGVAAGAVANDIVLVRNFDPTPALGQPSVPTLEDLAVLAVDAGGAGKLVVSTITRRGNRTSVRPSVGDATKVFVLDLPAAPRALAHIGPDVSDPFVYVADGTAGVSTIRLVDRPNANTAAAQLLRTTPIAGKTATAAALAGDMLYIGTAEGSVETFSLADPTTPVPTTTTAIGTPVTSLKIAGFILYVGTTTGVSALALDDPKHPSTPSGVGAPVAASVPVNGMAVSAGHVYVAAGIQGVFDVDMRTAAAPAAPVNLGAVLAPGQAINAVDVVVSMLPGQTWLIVLDANGDVWGLKLDNRQSNKERCFPSPATAGCLLDMSFYDATIMGRDPSFDPITNTFHDPADPNKLTADPSGGTKVGGVVQPFFHQVHALLSGGKRLAPPATWEAIGTLTGRRLRDSFMPGSGVLSLAVMQAMRSVKVCESTMPATTASGLGQLGYASGSGTCTALGSTARVAPPCPSVAAGGCALQRVAQRAARR